MDSAKACLTRKLIAVINQQPVAGVSTCNIMQDAMHQARRFMPLICYLLTGTAVTTVSQIIQNKVTEHRIYTDFDALKHRC